MFSGWFAGNVVRILSFALGVCWWVQVMVVVLATLVDLGGLVGFGVLIVFGGWWCLIC